MSNVIEQGRYTCAIGAMQSVVAIPRAVPVLHSGPGCGDMISGFFERSTGYAGGSASPCTNFSEKEVVFGGIDRLRDVVSNTYKVLDTDLQVILTGCTSGIVGDDVDALAEEFREAGKPVVAVETAGFKCNNYEAHSLVVNAIADQYVDLYIDENERRSERNTVNVFASLPYQDPFWKGNLGEYKRLLEGLGLKAHILFGPLSGGVGEWRRVPRANFNVLVSPWHGLPIAEHFESKYGQPYAWFPHIPIGANQTEKFLRQVLDFALENGADIDPIAAEKFIGRESRAYYEEIDNLATFLLEFRYGLPNHAHILHDAGYVVALSKFLLHEVGIVPKEQFVTDNTPEKFKERIRAELASTSDKREIPITFEPDAGLAQEAIRKLKHSGRGIIIGSGWDKELAKEKDYDFLPASLPSPYRLVLTTNYAGFSGGLRVIEDIYNTVLATYR
jgi:nitrogenase molybdenum-iron protein beta chain